MSNSPLLARTRICIIVAIGLYGELMMGPVHADAANVARAALLARAAQQCAIAIGLFDEALRNGGLSTKDAGLLIYSRGACYDDLGAPQKALADLNSAIAMLPDFASAYAYRGIVWGELHEFDRAIADFDQAKRITPEDPVLFNNLGNAYAAKGQPAQAIANYTRAIELRRDYAEAFYNRAAAYLGAQDDTQALADYDEAIQLKPLYGDAYSNRGALKQTHGELESAISDFDAAIRINQRDVRAWLNRANTYLLADRIPEATSDFSRVIEIDPGNAAAYLGRGRAALFSTGSGAGIEDFVTAHRLLPTSAYTVLWLHIARTHRDEDDTKEFNENSERARRDVWPGYALNLYDGKASPGDLLQFAGSSSEPDRSRQACEAAFYIGEYAVHHKPTSEARSLLLEAINRCQPQAIAYVAAKFELTRLGQ